MKKLFLYFVILSMIMILTACGGKSSSSGSNSEAAPSDLEILKPLAIENKVDEESLKEAVKILKQLGLDM